MPTYSGYVHYLKVLSAGYAFVAIGATSDDADLLLVTLDATDTTAKHGLKRVLIGLLSKACAYGFAVKAYMPTGSSENTSVQEGRLRLRPTTSPCMRISSL
jgi:hypothetical protein